MKKLQRKGRLLLRKFWALLGLLPAGALFQSCPGGETYIEGDGLTGAYGMPVAYGMPPCNSSISGKVIDDSAKPIPGIYVEIQKRGGFYGEDGTDSTDTNGEFCVFFDGEKDTNYIITFKDIDGEKNGSFIDKEYRYYTYNIENEDIGTIIMERKK